MNNIFLSCDWGTSAFRLRLIDAATLQSKVESQSDEGVAKVWDNWQQDKNNGNRILFYQAVLHRHIAILQATQNYSLAGVPVVVSGMASSSIGLKELPYKRLPFLLSGSDLYYEVIGSSGQFAHPIILISGARTENDVMRGEETQLAGCVQEGSFDGVYIFPGTHSKHIHVANGYATHFKTYMTGEFFSLLAQNSILSKSVAAGGAVDDRENRAAFEQGVLDGKAQNLLHASFMVRTNDLLQRFSKEANYWYLSGLLLGTELAALLQTGTTAVTIVAGGPMATSYTLAAKLLHIKAGQVDVTEALIKAHAAIFKRAAAG